MLARQPCMAALFAATILVSPANAQRDTVRRASDRTAAFIGTPGEDRARIDAILGRRSSDGWLLRSPSSMIATDTARFTLRFVRPVIDGRYNSQLPFSLDDGALWAGRGASTRLAVGMQVTAGPLHALIVPELTHSANLGFPLIPSTTPGRSEYALPYHDGPLSIDLPMRFGAAALTTVYPGQSAVWVSYRAIDAGVSTENQWWGPGIQNALVMSNNAPGIPSAFVRTAHPLRTRAGTFEGKAIAGRLTESLYFDNDPTNDQRSVSGVVATFSPIVEPNVSVGLAHAAYGNAPRGQSFATNALAALTHWSSSRADTSDHGSAAIDQLTSLFVRWIFPEAGLELYGETARMLLPRSPSDWLVAPQYTRGFTVGMQVARPVRADALLRFQAEFTSLEQSPTSRAADTLSFYTSRAVPQGFTQRGQSIGASTGPGSSSQFVGADFMRQHWDLGLFAQRIRWDNDIYYLQPTGFSYFSHDVTTVGGVRGTVRVGGRALHAEYSQSQRMNFLFQNFGGGFGEAHTNDFYNRSFRFWIGL